MKSTKNFKETIELYLKSKAFRYPLFAERLRLESKSIDDCITFILNQVKNSGQNGFTDDEIYGLAVHYYDEDNIDIGKPISAHVVVNHKPLLSPEEIETLKEEAKKKVVQEEIEKMRGSKKVSSKEKTEKPQTGTLF